jgi:hypothetical protein
MTDEEQPKTNVVGIGHSAKRPKNSRASLYDKLAAALLKDFEQHGEALIARVRDNDPVAYLRLIAEFCVQESRGA